MSNSIEVLTGSIQEVQMMYETLSDIINEVGGKVHDLQKDRDPYTGLMVLLVHYEVPHGQRESVKEKYYSSLSTMTKNRKYTV